MDYISELRIKTTHYILTGASIVVGLSWNETIKTFINTVYPLSTDAIAARIIYSLSITIMLVLLIRYMPETGSQLPKPVQRELYQSRIKN